MSNTQLFIPKRIKVGYQNRQGTFNGLLSYVIYIDNKGVLRKAGSWESWRDKSIEPNEYDNISTSGFVLNKKAGGTRSDWNTRATYCRVYDPRGIEIEISIPNLLFILQECDCNKGKGLEGEFVYAWDAKDLVLLPVSSIDYQASLNFTKLQDGKICKKDLVEGCIYENSAQRKLTYIGHLPFYSWVNAPRSRGSNITSKVHKMKKLFVFLKEGYKTLYTDNRRDRGIETLTTLTPLKNKLTTTPVENYAELVDEFVTHNDGSLFSHLEVRPLTNTEIKDMKSHLWSQEVYLNEGSAIKKYYCNTEYNRVTGKNDDRLTISLTSSFTPNETGYVKEYIYPSRNAIERLSWNEIQNKYGMCFVVYKNGSSHKITD